MKTLCAAFCGWLLAQAAGFADSALEWSISTPEAEVAPQSFPVIALHLSHGGKGGPGTPGGAGARRFTISVAGPVRSVSARELEVTLLRGEEKTLLHTLYVPPQAVGGSEAIIRVRADDGETREVRLKVKAAARFRARSVSDDKRFIRPGEKADYVVKIENTGNVPLHFTARARTSPEMGVGKVTPAELALEPGGTGEARVEVSTPADLKNFAALVTMVEVTTTEPTENKNDQFVYLNTEVFPEQEGAPLYEMLKGSMRLRLGEGLGGGRGGQLAFGEELNLEGMVSEETRLEFHQAYAHPSGHQGVVSQALSALPDGNRRNFFHLGLHNPRFDVEAGEVTVTPPRLLSPRELGDGGRVALRPLADKEALQVEAFAEQNTLTLTNKEVFGANISGKVRNSPIEWWRVGSLSKRHDVGPQGRDWDSLGWETGWKLPGRVPFRAEISAGTGANHEGESGVAWLAGLHYNRALPTEKDLSPLHAGVEFARGDKGFPGAQNGREDRRAYATLRLSQEPFVELFAGYQDSKYAVVPKLERTLAEEQSLAPDFLLTSQSRLVNGGIRWNPDPRGSGWRLPPGQFELQESTYFSRSNFFDQATEKTATLTLQPFGQPSLRPGAPLWHLNLLVRAGNEDHQNADAPASESQFGTLGADFNFSSPVPHLFERIGGPGAINFDLSARFTENFDSDPHAFNRTGATVSASLGWHNRNWTVKTTAAVYAYENEGIATRVAFSAERQIKPGWWAGLQGAYTQRGESRGGGSDSGEAAVMMTFRHDFGVKVPWLPRRGQAMGVIFQDLNNNGRRDPGESGLAGVKVAAGSAQTLTRPDGSFTLPAMASGAYPLKITAPDDVPYAQSGGAITDTVLVKKGEQTALAIGFIKPTACEGLVRFVREQPESGAVVAETKADDLSNLEIVATDAAGRTHRGVARADGFFAVYLEPGAYTLEIDPTTLKPDQVVTPAKLTVAVERSRVENLAFTVTQRVKHIRRTFVAQHP
jgi:hypothetical protein